jgi:hypothetical protein
MLRPKNNWYSSMGAPPSRVQVCSGGSWEQPMTTTATPHAIARTFARSFMLKVFSRNGTGHPD